MIIYDDKVFRNPLEIIVAFNTLEVQSAFERIENLKDKNYLVGYCRYEMKNCFEDESFCYPEPLLYFEVFKASEPFSPKDFGEDFYINPIPALSYREYVKAIQRIKSEISEGNTYEVNYTFDFNIDFSGNPFRLYNKLLPRQKTPYNAFFKNEFDTILSFSPELFFEISGRKIVAKPMKGTVARSSDIDEDLKNIEFLKNDIKNRAENVMIVDLLRNDLSRISEVGSVKVDSLFEIESHKTLHQMTSLVSANLREDISLYDIFKSLYPCGSITGAPKVSTMNIIDRFEYGTRNIYCGAIGFISPDKAVFSVPIRILQKNRADSTYKYRVGGAIVWDSNAKDEWHEAFTKAKILQPEFNLIETMRVKDGKVLFEKEHLVRLANSAKFFGFKHPTFSLPTLSDGIIRVIYSENGKVNFEWCELSDNMTSKVVFSDIPVDSRNVFLYHKTDFKPWYAESYKKIANGEVYDVIFFNERGEITEGARSNILVEKNGVLYTPSKSCGRLDGIYLNSLKNLVKTKLYKSDLYSADKIFCINSVRGCVEVYL